jgi:hypothetical protein
MTKTLRDDTAEEGTETLLIRVPKSMLGTSHLSSSIVVHAPPKKLFWESYQSLVLEWCCEQFALAGKRVLVLIWDNATWHPSQLVRTWLHTHNQQVKQSGTGVRILSCLLPTKSPWLNPIEAKWVYGKKNVVEADRLPMPAIAEPGEG